MNHSHVNLSHISRSNLFSNLSFLSQKVNFVQQFVIPFSAGQICSIVSHSFLSRSKFIECHHNLKYRGLHYFHPRAKAQASKPRLIQKIVVNNVYLYNIQILQTLLETYRFSRYYQKTFNLQILIHYQKALQHLDSRDTVRKIYNIYILETLYIAQ